MSPHRNLISSIAALEPVASNFAFTMSANAEADADTYATIGFDKLRRTSNTINNATFEPFKVYGLVALIFSYFASRWPNMRGCWRHAKSPIEAETSWPDATEPRFKTGKQGRM